MDSSALLLPTSSNGTPDEVIRDGDKLSLSSIVVVWDVSFLLAVVDEVRGGGDSIDILRATAEEGESHFPPFATFLDRCC